MKLDRIEYFLYCYFFHTADFSENECHCKNEWLCMSRKFREFTTMYYSEGE